MDLNFMFKRTDHRERRGTVEPPRKCRLKLLPEAEEELTEVQANSAESVVERNICKTTSLCLLLSADDNPGPIDDIINAGEVPQLVEFLEMDTCSELQVKAAWALTNIASGTSGQTKAVVDAGAVPILVKLLNSPDTRVREQATWALGNIAGDSTIFRDVVLDHDTFNFMLLPLCGTYPHELGLIQRASMALVNLCRGKPRPTLDKTEHALGAVSNVVANSKDVQMLTNVCWAVSHIMMEGTEDEYKAAANCDLMLHLMNLTKEGNPPSLVYAALHALGSFFDCDTDDMDSVSSSPYRAEMAKFIREGGLNFVHDVLKRGHQECNIEACWIVSRFTASSYDTIQAVIDNNIIQTLVNLLGLAEGILAVKKKAILAVKFAAIGGKRDQIMHLLDNGCVEVLLDALAYNDEEMLLDCVISEYHMLNSFQSLFKQKFLAAQGSQKMEFLRLHTFSKIKEAMEMFEKMYWSDVVADGVEPGGLWDEDIDIDDNDDDIDDNDVDIDGNDDDIDDNDDDIDDNDDDPWEWNDPWE